jgi:hypothetical protein
MGMGSSPPKILRKDFLYDAYDAFRERGSLSMMKGALNHLAFLLTFNYAGLAVGKPATRLDRDRLRQFGEERERIWYFEDPTTNHISELAHHGEHPVAQEPASVLDGRQYRRAKPRSFEQPFVTDVVDGRIVGSHPIGVTPSGSVIVDTFDYQSEIEWPYSSALGQILWNDGLQPLVNALFRPAQFRQSLKTTQRHDSLVLMDNDSARNYSHWTFEHLPKLRGVERYTEETGVNPTLVVEPDPPAYKRETLRLAGYGDDWIELPDEPVAADRLVIPSYPEPCYEGLSWVRNRMQANAETSGSVSSPERILLIRPDNIRRQFANRDDVEALLSKYGFATIAPETLGIAEQIQFFSEASVIIGAHGSALTNMLWPEETTVVELFADRIELGLYMLAEILGHDYEYILCDAVEARHLQVDLTELESTVDRVTNSSAGVGNK